MADIDNTPVNLEEARAARAAEMASEPEDASPEQAAFDGVELEEGQGGASPQPQQLNLDELFAEFGAAEFQNRQLVRELRRVTNENTVLRIEQQKLQNLVATKTATIRNLAKKTKD